MFFFFFFEKSSSTGMGSVRISLPNNQSGPSVAYPVLSHLVDGTVPGQPMQIRLDVMNDELSLYIDGVPLLPKDSVSKNKISFFFFFFFN